MTDAARRKALRDAYKRGERASAWDRLTLDRPALDRLLDHLDERLSEPCDHTLRFTEEWARGESRDWPALEAALADAGGGCDCEVLANVDPEG